MKQSMAQRSILEALGTHGAPTSAALLGKQLGKIHRTTAYRALKTLEQKGTIRKMIINGTTMYEREAGEHCHHITCTDCKKVEHVPFCGIGRMEQAIGRLRKFAITGHAIEFFGICAACGKK